MITINYTAMADVGKFPNSCTWPNMCKSFVAAVGSVDEPGKLTK